MTELVKVYDPLLWVLEDPFEIIFITQRDTTLKNVKLHTPYPAVLKRNTRGYGYLLIKDEEINPDRKLRAFEYGYPGQKTVYALLDKTVIEDRIRTLIDGQRTLIEEKYKADMLGCELAETHLLERYDLGNKDV